MNYTKKILFGFLLAVVIGPFLGYELYTGILSDSEIQLIMFVSVAVPVLFALSSSYRSKKNLFWEVMSPSLKEWGLAVTFTALALLIGAVVSTKLYCTYGACSEFAGLEIMLALMWIPLMAGISVFISLVGTVVLLRMRGKKF